MLRSPGGGRIADGYRVLYRSLSGVRLAEIRGANGWLDPGDKPRDDRAARRTCHRGACPRDPPRRILRTPVGGRIAHGYRVLYRSLPGVRLVWFQEFGSVREAIQREKTMKEWPRVWKINLIERENPHWIDLYPSLPGVRPAVIRGVRGWVDRGDKPRDDT